MCGIAGLVNLAGTNVDPEVVRSMCDLIQHRGPDDSGLWWGRQVALGHRRLSIIDLLPRGRNPMPNEDETVWLVANGEIYNFKELRSRLENRGHRFRSETDTEVIVHLYEEMGDACVGELNGMFAFALWDVRNKSLLLARDRFGVKPVYYTQMNQMFAFASEIKAFLALPTFSPGLCYEALAEHLTFHNTFGDITFFRGVKLLEAGHCVTVREGSVTDREYWDLAFHADSSRSLDDWSEDLRQGFESAVRRQLMSDVPLGTYLSGGMDTGSISAVTRRTAPELHTFTCGFDVPEEASDLEQFFDERAESHRLARFLGTTHHEITLGPHVLPQVLPLVVWHLDEPRVGISYQVYCTTEMIRQYVTVVLSGVGGDELFAGYPWRYEQVLAQVNGAFESSYYKLCARILSDEEKEDLFTPEARRALKGYSSYERFAQVAKGSRGADPLHRALHFDFKTFLNGLLVVEDKLSMAHAVESRVPFLDNDLVDLVRRIPSQFKFQAGQGKIVLRQAMKNLLPEATLSRRKQGFTPPDRTWYQGACLNYVRELILGPRAMARGYFEPRALQRILDDHLANRRDHRFLIWSMMCLEWWSRFFLDRETKPNPDYAKDLRVSQ